MKKMVYVMTAAVLLGVSVGCGVKDLDTDGVLDYLDQRYEREFTCVSSKETPRSLRNYLDPRMETVAEAAEDRNCDDIVDVYEDGDGLQFHVVHMLRYGVVGSWIVEDDYAVQWLMAQPELYQPLEDSDYGCEYYNTIGIGEDMGAGFTLMVSDISEIRPAAELAFETIANDAAILPDHGIYSTKDDIQGYNHWREAIIPKITLMTEDGQKLGSLRFRTQQIPQMTDEENFIRYAESEYCAQQDDGADGEKILSESIPLMLGEEQISSMQLDLGGRYCVVDSVELGKKLDYPILRAICEYCGCTFQPKGEGLLITRGEDTVAITRRKGEGYNYSLFSIKKNNVPYIPEGEFDNVLQEDQCCLTIADLHDLLGIDIHVDYENRTAEVCR